MGANETGLDERSRGVLASVVCAYIRSAAPVSTRQLTKTGSFGLSSASLRNAMADLEDLGFLTHPHVSAGRVPTDKGYRTFVSELMTATGPSPEERAHITREMGPESFEMDRFLHAASRLLSRLTGEVGVAAAPDAGHFILEAVHFTRVAERKVVVMQVSEAGLVDNRLIETRDDYSQTELDDISKTLTADFGRHSLLAISQLLVQALQEEKVRFDSALARTLELGRLAFSGEGGGAGELFVEGTERILEKPDFSGDIESLRRMFRAFDEKARLVRLLTDCLSVGGTTATSIVIGSESPFTEETRSAVVTTAYRRGGQVLGVLGVIGPRRMEYARVVPMVEELGRYVTRRLTEGAS